MTVFPAEEILTGRLRLRLTRLSDAEDVAKSCADPVTREFLPELPHPYTVDDAVFWIENRASRAFDEGRAQWAIADRETDRLLGSIGFPMVLAHRGHAEVGYWVSPWARGKGIATEAVVAVTDWAFAHDMNRMVLITDLANIASQRTALAAGFRREALLRGDHMLPDGTRRDTAQFARLSDDPPGRAPRALPDLPEGRLTDGTVVLRPLLASDAADSYAIMSDPDVARSAGVPMTLTPERIQAYTAGAYAQWLAGESARMAIRDAATDEFAGEVHLYRTSPAMGIAKLGIHLGPRWRGRGFASRAVALTAEWAFAEAGVQRLEAGTAVWNEASQAVMARLGFTREGVRRSYLPGHGDEERTDNVEWSLLPGELRGRGA